MNIKTRQSEAGFITLIALAILLIMLLLVTVNRSTAIRLGCEVREVERRQVARLTVAATNQPPASANPAPSK